MAWIMPTGITYVKEITRPKTNAQTGIWVGQTSILIMPKTNMDTNTTRYHQSGTMVARQRNDLNVEAGIDIPWA